MKNRLFIFIALLLVLASSVGAQTSTVSSFTSYRKYKDISNLSIKTPTVVEVSFGDQYIERLNFTILDKTSGIFEPYFLRREILKNEAALTVSSLPYISYLAPPIDNNPATYAEFPLPESTQGFVKITLTSGSAVTSSALAVLLDNFVALPNFIEISAEINGRERIVLAKKELSQNTINFPKTTSNKWAVSFWYSQPLRISELKLIQEDNLKNTLSSVRFLAQPGHSYRIYFDPDRYTNTPVGEAGNLFAAKNVKILSNIPTSDNGEYVIADTDADGVPDINDNCVSDANPDQADINTNGRGDVCDDFDQDQIINIKDNCPDNPNRDQRDVDGDDIGDVCDGRESRLTEQYPWIPWLGIGFAALVLVTLFAITAKSKPKADDGTNL